MNTKFLKELGILTKRLESFIKLPSKRGFAGVDQQINSMLDNLFVHFGDPLYHTNPAVFMQRQMGIRMSSHDFPGVLRALIAEGRDTVFLDSHPFSEDLLALYDFLANGFESNQEQLNQLNRITTRLKGVFIENGIIQNLKEMREFAKAAAGLQVDVSVSDNIKTLKSRGLLSTKMAMGFFSSSIKKYIPPSLQSKEGYRNIKWKKFQLLGGRIRNADAYANSITTRAAELADNFKQLAQFINQLIFLERSNYDSSVVVPALHNQRFDKVEEIIDPIEDQLNIKEALIYLKNIKKFEDGLQGRMAILRVITVLGEMAVNLSPEVRNLDKNLFIFLQEMRNGVVHAEEYRSIHDQVYSMIRRVEDRRLIDSALVELRKIDSFLKDVLAYSKDNTIARPTAISSTLPGIKALHADLTKVKKLTSEQKQKLLKILPTGNAIKVQRQRLSLEKILLGSADLPARYSDFEAKIAGLGLGKKSRKALFVKLTQCRICDEISKKLKADDAAEEVPKLLAKIQTKEKSRLDALRSSLNSTEVREFIEMHKNKCALPKEEINTLLAKLPVEELDITTDKAVLQKMVLDEKIPAGKEELKRIIDRLCLSQEGHAQYLTAYQILSGEFRYYKRGLKNMHRRVLRDIEQLQLSIAVLGELTEEVRKEGIVKEFLENDALVFSCEQAYNTFIDYAKDLDQMLDIARDYNDLNVTSIFLSDPFTELQNNLRQYITRRNDIFHLESIYSPSGLTRAGYQMQLFGEILDRVEGTVYPDSLEIGARTLRRVPIKNDSLYKKLESIATVIRTRVAALPIDSNPIMEVTRDKKGKYSYKQSLPKTRVLQIPGDGDCMFRSTVEGIKRINQEHMPEWVKKTTIADLRERVANEINGNIGFYFDEISFQLMQNIRDGELAGYPEPLLTPMRNLYNKRVTCYSKGAGIVQVESDIYNFTQKNAVGQYIDLLRQPGKLWGGAVELGVLSKILKVQFFVYRNAAGVYHIDNSQTEKSTRIDLDYTGNHYNLFLLPGMTKYREIYKRHAAQRAVSSQEFNDFLHTNNLKEKDSVVPMPREINTASVAVVQAGVGAGAGSNVANLIKENRKSQVGADR